MEDAKKMRFMTDRFGRFQKEQRMNPVTRRVTGEMYDPDDGSMTVPVAYVHEDDEEGDIPFARDEIIHFNKYSASARLYGQSPILGLARKIETGLAIEKYQNKIYRLERPPKGFLDIPNVDEKGLSRLGEYIAQETKRNPNFVPIISSGEGGSSARFVPVMPNMSELEMLPYIDRINQDINSAFGVMPLAVGDTTGIGGLNAEGEQVTMMDKTILETQECITLGFANKLLDLMKITDYEFTFTELNDENEQVKLQNLSMKADIITKFQQIGIELDLDPDGEIILPEVIQSPNTELLEEEEPREQVDIFQP
jgi:phage portal protein BeeE